MRVLGSVSVEVDGRPVPVGGPLPRRLLAVLLANRGAVLSVDRLVEVLWGDEPSEAATSSLHTYVSRLRRLLPPSVRLETAAPGYRLRLEPGAADVDLDRFETLIAEAREADAGRTVTLLGEALDLWHGRAFGEFADEEWARPEAVRLGELQAAAVEDRVEALLALGRFAEAGDALTGHVAAFPLRDRPRGLLMRTLAAQGRQTEALRAYQEYRHYLGEEIGTEPSSELRDLEARIAAGWHDAPEPAGHRGACAAEHEPPGAADELRRTVPPMSSASPRSWPSTAWSRSSALAASARHAWRCRPRRNSSGGMATGSGWWSSARSTIPLTSRRWPLPSWV